MARLLRVEALEVPHHVTQRGNARRLVFESDNDRLVYLALIVQHAKTRGVVIDGYCLMPNHLHLILTPLRDTAMARVLRDTNGRYATYLNSRQAASGHVWQGRYYSCPMDMEHLWNALRYVELNPVRAGLARRSDDYAWSSARAHLRGERDGITDLTSWASRWTTAGWREFVEAPSAGDEAIRDSTHRGRPLGSAEFVERLEKMMKRRLAPAKGGRPKKLVEVGAALW
jgi:REP-associated tyrosine transposase